MFRDTYNRNTRRVAVRRVVFPGERVPLERIDLDNWKAKEVARLLTLVENDRRYYQEILTSLPIPVAVVGRELNLVMVNRAFRWSFQLKHDDLGEKRFTDLIPHPGVKERVQQAFVTRSPEAGIRFTCTGQDGLPRECRLTVIPLWDAYHEQPDEAVVVVEEPDKVESPAAHLLDQLDAVAWRFDVPTGEMVFLSRGLTRVTGPGPDLQKREWQNRVEQEDASRVAWVYEAAIDSGLEASVSYRARQSDGQPVWLYDRIHPILDNGRVVALEGITSEATAERARTARLIQQREMEANMRLAQQVAHEFNNLWMIVAGYAEVLADRCGEDEENRSSLQAIVKAAERGIGSTSQLLQFGRPPTAHNKLQDLHELLKQWELPVQLQLMETPAGVAVDGAKLESCVRTLVDFAVSRHPATPLTIETGTEMFLADHGDSSPRGQFVSLRVGPVAQVTAGMEAHWCEPKFFLGVERLEGVGLAPCYSQLRQMGIWITLERTDAANGRFVLLIPKLRLPEVVRKPVEVVEPVEAPVVVEAPAAPKLERVLVVDDEESIRGLVSRILSRQGYQVIEAGSAEEALVMTETLPEAVEAVVSDVMLPGMRGPEMVLRLRKKYPDLRVLYISGYAEDPDLVAGLLPSGEGFLQKPFSVQALVGGVRGVLDAARS